MTVSVRMDPLPEKKSELAAKRMGVTRSQFVIDAAPIVATFGSKPKGGADHDARFKRASKEQGSLTAAWFCVEKTQRPARTAAARCVASRVRLASDTGLTRMMTINRRDFSRFRLPGGRAFEIL